MNNDDGRKSWLDAGSLIELVISLLGEAVAFLFSALLEFLAGL